MILLLAVSLFMFPLRNVVPYESLRLCGFFAAAEHRCQLQTPAFVQCSSADRFRLTRYTKTATLRSRALWPRIFPSWLRLVYPERPAKNPKPLTLQQTYIQQVPVRFLPGRVYAKVPFSSLLICFCASKDRRLQSKKNRPQNLCCRFHHSLTDSLGDHVGVSVHRVNVRI